MPPPLPHQASDGGRPLFLVARGSLNRGIEEKKEKGMEVRLKREWHGNPVGAIVKVNDDCANAMFQRDTAEKMEIETNVAIKDKLQRMVTDRSLKKIKK